MKKNKIDRHPIQEPLDVDNTLEIDFTAIHRLYFLGRDKLGSFSGGLVYLTRLCKLPLKTDVLFDSGYTIVTTYVNRPAEYMMVKDAALDADLGEAGEPDSYPNQIRFIFR